MKSKRNLALRMFRADEPKPDDGRVFRDVSWAVETREVGEGEGKKTERVVRCSVSSETPYPRYMKDPETGDWVRGLEVLGHNPDEIDDSRMKDGLVIQDTHWGDQIGIMDKPEVKDGKIVGTIRFGHSQKARDIEADALDGIKKNMSVGYIVKEYKRDGVDEATKLPIFRVTKWMPYEASFVNCPADPNIGVGRSAAAETPHGNGAGEETNKKTTTANHAAETRGSTMKLTPEERQKIRELASAAHVSGEEVVDMLTSERSFEELREELLNRREKYIEELAKKPATPAAERKAVLDEGAKREIAQKYDIVKVVRYLTEMADMKSSSIDIGFEREISAELANKTGRAVQGILLPDFVRAGANTTDGSLTLGTPAFDATTSDGGISGIGGGGKNLVETLLLAGHFVEALVAALVLREACGVEVLTGLVGNVSIPKGESISGGWIAEGANAPKKNPTFGQITASPHTFGAYVDITRKLLLQSSINVQGKILQWLMYACANGLETAAFQGTGADGQPKGLCTALTGTAWGNAPTFDKIVDLIAAAKIANSYKPSMKFVGNAGVWAKLAKTRDYEVLTDGAASDAKNVGAIGGSTRLLDTATNKLIGRDFVEANLMPAKKLLFGDFTQLTVCLWSGTDIIVDPYANSTNGGLRLVALQDSDILIKRTESFGLATGVHA
jgi:HK97 family phage major capsid protein